MSQFVEAIDRTRRTPQMWAVTMDGYITRLGTILELSGADPRRFYDALYQKGLFKVGWSRDYFEDEWAHTVCDIARSYL